MISSPACKMDIHAHIPYDYEGALEEAVFGGEAGRGRPRADPQLVVDGVEVPLDGAWAQVELLGDLSIRHSLGHKF